MVVIVMMFGKGLPHHKERYSDDNDARDQLKPRLDGLSRIGRAKMEAQKGNKPDDRRMGQGCRQTEQHRLPDRAANGDDEGPQEGSTEKADQRRKKV